MKQLTRERARANSASATNKKKFPDGYIYIIQYGNENIYKIGVSQNPKRRIRDIDSASPIPIRIVDLIWFKNVYEMEECIHDSFNNNLIRREWFMIESEDIKILIDQLKDFESKGQYLIRKQ